MTEVIKLLRAKIKELVEADAIRRDCVGNALFSVSLAPCLVFVFGISYMCGAIKVARQWTLMPRYY